MVNLNLFETQIVWRTNVINVLLISSKTDTVPTIYRCSVKPIDINELKGKPKVIEVGFYLKDYIGHTFKITEVNESYILVSDDFNCGECPQNSQQGVIYQSVANGDSPFLMPSFYSHLHHSALDYSRQMEVDILWRQITTDKNFLFIQNIPSNIWTINHNLNKYPSVTVIDSAGTEVEGTVEHVDINNILITFNGSFSGKAFIN